MQKQGQEHSVIVSLLSGSQEYCTVFTLQLTEFQQICIL